MSRIIGLMVFIIMLVTLLANPAPSSIEIADLILIITPCFLAFLSLTAINNFKIYRPECDLLIAIILYLSYLLFSVLLGFINGVPMLNALRSLGPYINFYPLLCMGMLPIRLMNPWMIGSILIMIGSLQASYHIYLFFTHTYGEVDTLDILRGRITLIEPRTTLPIILSTTVLSMAILSYKSWLLKLLAAFLMLFGLFAGAATLTRSIIISIMIGWLSLIILYFYKQCQVKSFSFKLIFSRFCLYFSLFVATVSIISIIPKVHMLEQGILARFYYNHMSTTSSSDYSNGRLYDEWIPALNAWADSGLISLFFGIGAGNTFKIVSGEERTYIHNLVIYDLVYGGFYGLFASLWLYFTVFKTLIIRALQSDQLIYLAFAALLVSIFTYAQLFAVHKGLAFNAMLFLIISLALCQPEKKVS